MELPLLVATTVLAAVAAVAVLIYRSRKQIHLRQAAAEREREAIDRARAIPLPAKAVPLRTDASSGDPGSRDGRIMLVLVGTFGESIARFLLAMLARAGLDRAIGSVLLLEFDDGRREQFRQSAPVAFRDKIVFVSGMPGGFGNRSGEDARRVIVRWGPEVLEAVRRVIAVHMLRNEGQEPSIILTLLGLGGGHSEAGAELVRQLSLQLPDARNYGWCALPVHDKLRSRTHQVLASYQEAGVRGWIAADNLQDSVQNDFGMIASIACFISAPRDADAAVEINNALLLVLDEAPGHIATLTTYARSIPAYRMQRHEKLPNEFYVFEDSVRNTVLNGLDLVRTMPDSLGYQVPEALPANTSVFDLVIAPIVRHDFKRVEDKVVQGLELGGGQKRNYQLQFASVAMQIDPEAPECPIAVIQVRPLVEAPARIQELAAPQPYQYRSLPNGSKSAEHIERKPSDA